MHAYPPAIFSLFWHSSAASDAFEYIEPLAGVLRHPASYCGNTWHRSPGLKPAWNFQWQGHKADQVVRKSPLEHFERDHLLLSNSVWADPGKRKLFDAGAAEFNSSLKWLLDEYYRNGIEFDEIFAWEIRPDVSFESVPDALRKRIILHKRAVVAEERHMDNPVHQISQLCKVQDFCVLKLDIDDPDTERTLLHQLQRDGGPGFQGVLDEFFWEDHVDLPSYGLYGGKGSLSESYERFVALRQMGIRAHYWP